VESKPKKESVELKGEEIREEIDKTNK